MLLHRNLRHTLLLGLGLGVGLASCQKLDLPPTDRPTDATFWSQPSDADNVLNTAYEHLYSDEYFFFNEVLSDNAYDKSDVNGSNARNIAEGAYGTNQQRVTDEWSYHYTGIRRCNQLLANIDKISSLDAGLKTRYIAEARALRAYQYFQLLTWYGDVPLITTEIGVGDAAGLTRTPRAEVLDFVLKELDAAAADLPLNTGLRRHRPRPLYQGRRAGREGARAALRRPLGRRDGRDRAAAGRYGGHLQLVSELRGRVCPRQ